MFGPVFDGVWTRRTGVRRRREGRRVPVAPAAFAVQRRPADGPAVVDGRADDLRRLPGATRLALDHHPRRGPPSAQVPPFFLALSWFQRFFYSFHLPVFKLIVKSDRFDWTRPFLSCGSRSSCTRLLLFTRLSLVLLGFNEFY